MQHEQEPSLQPDEMSQESFLGGFTRVPSGLDPTQVYSYFLRTSARVQQVEEQARRVSAPLLLESALREATEVRTQSAQAAERTYNEIVLAAQQEAERLRLEAQRRASDIEEQARQDSRAARSEAEQQASAIVVEARAALAEVQRQAEELLDNAHREGARVRREAEEWNERTEQELERICVDFAAFLQQVLERRQATQEARVRAEQEWAAASAASTALSDRFAAASAPAEILDELRAEDSSLVVESITTEEIWIEPAPGSVDVAESERAEAEALAATGTWTPGAPVGQLQREQTRAEGPEAVAESEISPSDEIEPPMGAPETPVSDARETAETDAPRTRRRRRGSNATAETEAASSAKETAAEPGVDQPRPSEQGKKADRDDGGFKLPSWLDI